MNIKILTSTTFAALLGVLAAYPAIAQNAPMNNQMQAPGRELLTPATGDDATGMEQTQMQMENQRPMNSQMNGQMQSPGRELLTPASGGSNQMMMDGSNQRTIERRTVEETQMRRIQTTPIPARTNVQTQQQFQSQPTRTDTQFNNVNTSDDNAPVRGLW